MLKKFEAVKVKLKDVLVRLQEEVNNYFVINIDEPYAEEIYEVLKKGQAAKGEWPEGDISFEEWKRQAFSPPKFSIMKVKD